MRSLLAFTKKEWLQQLRTAKLLILLLLFAAAGLLNPVISKLTPWMMELMADSFAQMGMEVPYVAADAMASWVQFFKNLPIVLIAFVVVESGIFTREYRTGTLILALTKGLERYKAVLAKAAVLLIMWTACYWIYFACTFGLNALFWEEQLAQNIGFAAVCWWLIGLLAAALMTLFSAAGRSNIVVLAGTGAAFLAIYLLGMPPMLTRYLPAMLMDANPLISGAKEAGEYLPAVVVTVLVSAACIAASVPLFNKKKL